MHRFPSLSLNNHLSRSICLSGKTGICSVQGSEAPRLLTTTAWLRDSQQSPNVVENQRAEPLISVFNVPAPHVGHIRVFSLKSPHNKNAISRQLLGELNHHIQGLKNAIEKEASAFEKGDPGATLGSGTRVIVIRSEVDGVFCAGADLKERKNMTASEYVDSTLDQKQAAGDRLSLLDPALPMTSLPCGVYYIL